MSTSRCKNGLRAVLLCLALALSACSTLPRNALPAELADQAAIPGMPVIRAYGGKLSPYMMADLGRSFEQESAEEFPVASDGKIHYPHLALSGGGQNGAFGAGLMNGWTKNGTRPVFKIVTGVSSGAMMAPFVFLGPEYDDELQEFYSNTSSKNIFSRLSILPQLLRGESLLDSAPLQTMIAQLVDADFLESVAKAHKSGRRLYIGTTDLDSQQLVVWNMGLIANSGHPEALDLFRKIMLASSSIPVAFPPVLFKVEADGRNYDELHVDGAVKATVFYSAGVFNFESAQKSSPRGPGREDIYIIHNGQLGPVHGETRRTLASIAYRSIEVAAKSAVIGDLFRIYTSALRSQSGFYWVTIPTEVSLESNEMFDPVTMRRLFDFGIAKAQRNDFWFNQPPGLTQ
jgi:Patatin-like phospholipase